MFKAEEVKKIIIERSEIKPTVLFPVTVEVQAVKLG